MSDHFATIDRYMSSQRMPPEMRNRRSTISCNDCHTNSVVPYHYLYHKCSNAQCGGYNTHVKRVFERGEAQSAPRGAEEHSTTAPRDAVARRAPSSECSSESSPNGTAGGNGSSTALAPDGNTPTQATSASQQPAPAPSSPSSSPRRAAPAAVASSRGEDSVTGSATTTAAATAAATATAAAAAAGRYYV
ncbi:Zinc finger protein BRUTUS-like [Gracilariopsis chorda]|uniref:Zinc finger protein BRUTUS-like n=1 Tax=Gracilariopsis chorda TaxID=448386 RepID=A0A2V3IN32_9FLOR|nr:Zinc finger protein BRUTUS-like [Gracilariopsis chorda]|eukprot:PXF43491.1 Zinc finger protein BRUTUS-like [Gracilariopsis chorda]